MLDCDIAPTLPIDEGGTVFMFDVIGKLSVPNCRPVLCDLLRFERAPFSGEE